jgi:hypothetical protein
LYRSAMLIASRKVSFTTSLVAWPPGTLPRIVEEDCAKAKVVNDNEITKSGEMRDDHEHDRVSDLLNRSCMTQLSFKPKLRRYSARALK